MQKSVRWLVILGFLVTALIMVGCAPKATPAPTPAATPKTTPTSVVTPTTPAKVYELKMATQYKSDEVRGASHDAWAKAVDSASGGRIKIKIFYADTFVKTSAVPEAISKGLVDLAMWYAPYYGLTPVGNLAPTVAVKDARKYLQDLDILDLLNKEAEEKANIRLLFNIADGGSEFYTRKSVSGPGEMKGMVVRTSGGLRDEYYKAWGGSPVTMPSGEVYAAAQRGTVDAVAGGVQAYYTTKLYEVLPYMLQSRLWTHTLVNLAMNLDVWKSLPNDLQKVLVDEGWKAARKLYDDVEVADKTGIDDLTKKGLVKVTALSPNLRDEWLKRVTPAAAEQFKKSGPLGEKVWALIQQRHN